MEILEIKEENSPNTLPILTVAVAVKGNKNSRYAIKWALDKFIPEGKVAFRLIHIRPEIKKIPTPMGSLPITQVREDVASAYKKEVEWETTKMLAPFKQMCIQRKVEVEMVIVEANDVANAISAEISKHAIGKLVVNASSKSILTRSNKLSSRISESVPNFCTVYVVSKGKLSSVQASTSLMDEIKTDSGSSSFGSSDLSSISSGQSGYIDIDVASFNHTPLSIQRELALAYVNQQSGSIMQNPLIAHSRSKSLYTDLRPSSSSAPQSEARSHSNTLCSHSSFGTDSNLFNSDQFLTSAETYDFSRSDDQLDVTFELERLKIELMNLKKFCGVVPNESINSSEHVKKNSSPMELKYDDNQHRADEERLLANQEMEAHEETKRESESKVLQRKNLDSAVSSETNVKPKIEMTRELSDRKYSKYEWHEIESATSSFSEGMKIGKGAHGTVYKGNIHQMTVAIKVLNSFEGHQIKQFKRELEILSRTHHPHLLLLLGACLEQGCLIYEYMENGSLEDRLQCKNNTPPLPWFYRYRIAWEVATALLFLHSTEPEPIIHRDLKPANILLDHNFISRVGDVGLSTLLPSTSNSFSTMIKDTAPVGTFCYIDPEYQRTGQVSPKSDVYAFGMVILQLLTAKSPIGLAHSVERALEDGHLMSILDTRAGQWPPRETLELARIGLQCVELRRKDRPNLKEQILPILERLKLVADNTYDQTVSVSSAPPNHFICPIVKEVMEDPCVASDGYTYDRKAIEEWLRMNRNSPMTNLPLPDKSLITNYSLLSAILEWKARTQWQSQQPI